MPSDISVGSKLHTLIRLFYLSETVPSELVRAALEPLSLEQVLSSGFCRLKDGQVVSDVLLQPYANLLLHAGQTTLPVSIENLVMQISATSLELANLMNPSPVRNALDLGTGCGFLALLLSPRAERVYALDLNPAAVQLAEFNARWNSLSNITCLQGNLFEPVGDLRFDLIVCNPPFFICPVPDSSTNRVLFEHSGQEGDSFCIQIARDAPSFLEEGGFFHMMFSWIQSEGQDWRARLTAPFSGLGCDVWCLRTGEESPEEYVSTWSAHQANIQDMDGDSLRRRGLAYFEEHKIAAVGTGLLTLHRCTTPPNHLWFDDAPDDRSEPYGSSVATIFDLRANFDSADEEFLLKAVFAVAPDVALVNKTARTRGRWEVIASEFCRDSGLKYTFSGVDPLLAEIVTHLDGRSSLRLILGRLSKKHHLALSNIIAAHLPNVRELLRFGFLLPVSPDRPLSRLRQSSGSSSR